MPKIQGTPASGSLASAQGLQFQQDDQCYVVLALAPMEDLRYTLFHEFSHLIDTQVMNRCSAYDDWTDLNPQEFAYSLDVNADMTPYKQYLTGTNRCFVDYYAMVNPAEDRARIFECAVNPGNGDMFAAEAPPHLHRHPGGLRAGRQGRNLFVGAVSHSVRRIGHMAANRGHAAP